MRRAGRVLAGLVVVMTVSAAEVPQPVVDSAVAAVGKLGEQLVQGNRGYSVERMYPRWKQRMAMRLGGMDALKAKLAEQIRRDEEQMRLSGMSMVSSRPDGKPLAFEVWPGKETRTVEGEKVEVMIKTKWLVLVPTVTKFRVIERETSKTRFIERLGFQAAVTKKGEVDWTFVGGEGLGIEDLRSLFPSVPAGVLLPKTEWRKAD